MVWDLLVEKKNYFEKNTFLETQNPGSPTSWQPFVSPLGGIKFDNVCLKGLIMSFTIFSNGGHRLPGECGLF